MRKTISVTEQYEISGEWSLEGSLHAFKGKVTKRNDPSFSKSLRYDIPIGAMKRFGQKLMEEDIESSVIDEIGNNWTGQVQNEGQDQIRAHSFKPPQPTIFSWLIAVFRRNPC